jgi:NodT family efflux transporter outer membrane factor (OMF) lipoprotein
MNPLDTPGRKSPPRTAIPSALAAAAALSVSIAMALAGCSTPVARPSVDVPDRFAMAPESRDEPEVAWWESFGDPVLSDLIRRAARENRDVRIAAERVRAARAGETISRSALYPSLSVGAAAIDQRTGYDAQIRQQLPNTKATGAGADVFWEIDISGRLRAGAAAAAADTVATEYGARAVRLMVLSDVATNYSTLVGTLRQLEIVRAISAAQDETLRLVTSRQRVGLAAPFDVERAQTEASRARAAIPQLETLAAVSRHRIAVLIGDQAFNAAELSPWSGEMTVPTAHPGQPAALIQRRPDLLAAKAQLDAANARRRQAQAEWFPRLFLNALFGRESVNVNGMALGPARFSNVGALIAVPVLNAGRTRSINEIAESAQSEAVMRYEDSIVRALEDVENALAAFEDERRREQDLRSAAESADAALGRAQSLYGRGQTDLLPLLDAQRTRLTVRVAANDSHTQLLLNGVQLFKALGGGWEVFEPSASPQAGGEPRSPNS